MLPVNVLLANDEVPAGNKKSVKFVQVEVREYNRAHGGSAGVPKHGAYTLGLDWSYDKQMKRSVSDFEMEKNPDCSEGVKWMNEQARKKVLDSADKRDKMTKQNSFKREKQEISQIRKSRKHIGCSCKGNLLAVFFLYNSWIKGDAPCSSKKCQCIKNEIVCYESSCGCDPSECGNPREDTLDTDTIDELRRQKIEEMNKDDDESNSDSESNHSDDSDDE